MKSSFAWDDILVYVVTFFAVFVAQYIKVLNSHGHVTLEERYGHLLFSGVIALGLVLQSEGFITSATSRIGKRKNLRRRLFEGLSHGLGTSGTEALAT